MLLLYPIFFLVIFNIGVGLILSALYVFFRDVQYLWTIFIQLLMYMSAIFYTVDGYPALMQKLFYLNPVYAIISYFRKIVIYGTIPTPWHHGLILFYALLALGIGALIYKKYNTQFLYYV